MIFTFVADAPFSPRAALHQLPTILKSLEHQQLLFWRWLSSRGLSEACHNNAQDNVELKDPQNP
jgi:hypothetical protein